MYVNHSAVTESTFQYNTLWYAINCHSKTPLMMEMCWDNDLRTILFKIHSELL